MNIGISVPLPAYHVDVAFMARKAEELGFESFWCAEHPFIPVRTTSRFPGSEDGVIPESYSHFVDPFVALARASGVTTRVKLGTGIVLVPERNPLLLAKEVSTLDLFSGGRFLFGIGAGWLREETQIMGGDFDHRWAYARESVLAMKALWKDGVGRFDGTYVKFGNVRCDPMPVQRPSPPGAALSSALIAGSIRSITALRSGSSESSNARIACVPADISRSTSSASSIASASIRGTGDQRPSASRVSA